MQAPSDGMNLWSMFPNDWQKLCRSGIREESGPVTAGRGAAAETSESGGREDVAVPWSFFEEE